MNTTKRASETLGKMVSSCRADLAAATAASNTATRELPEAYRRVGELNHAITAEMARRSAAGVRVCTAATTVDSRRIAALLDHVKVLEADLTARTNLSNATTFVALRALQVLDAVSQDINAQAAA